MDEFFYETMIPDTEDETVYRFSLMKYLEFALRFIFLSLKHLFMILIQNYIVATYGAFVRRDSNVSKALQKRSYAYSANNLNELLDVYVVRVRRWMGCQW